MKTIFKLFVIVVLVLTSIKVHSVAISSKRLYLDQKNSSTNMYIYNSAASEAECRLFLREGLVKSNGKIALDLTNLTSEISATKLLRFSPKRFQLKSGGSQKVNFAFRRRPDTKSGEYLSLLGINCQDKVNRQEAKDQQVSIKPALVHNVPIIVRTTTIPLNVNLEIKRFDSRRVQVEVNTIGNRSITGDLMLIDSNSEEIISKLKDISIYPIAPTMEFTLQTNDQAFSRLQVKFKENPKLGGNIETSIKVN